MDRRRDRKPQVSTSEMSMGEQHNEGLPTESGGAFAALYAADVVRELAPTCSSSVLTRLRREGIVAAVDLIGLEKDDLRELGFTMLERSRLLRWARGELGVSGVQQEQEQEQRASSASHADSGHRMSIQTSMGVFTSPHAAESMTGEASARRRAMLQEAIAEQMLEPDTDVQTPEEREAQQKLDEVEQNASFWCGLVQGRQDRRIERTHSFAEMEEDLRENVLEGFFDLTSERVKHLYGAMKDKGKVKGAVDSQALRYGLRICGLSDMDDKALDQVIKAVGSARRHRLAKGAKGEPPEVSIDLPEFEAVLSRLKLAQLLTGCAMPLDTETLGGRRTNLGSAHVGRSGTKLTVVDYNIKDANAKPVHQRDFKTFFFGHRKSQTLGEPPLVRWVHMEGLDLMLLLALTVKYSLHPLGVEDVIEQCPTKIDRYGSHYFAAVEQLCLASASDGSEAVKVHGRHVAVFCSGPPLFDTILTITEPDHDEKEDWPGGSMRGAEGVGDAWVERLKERLKATHSRLRERRADFLMYQVMDLSSDELVKVTRAYTTRISKLADMPHITSDGIAPGWLREIELAKQQLVVVAMRLKSMRRLLGKVIEDGDLTAGLSGYVSDVRDHVDEAHEETSYLRDRCTSMVKAAEQVIDRHTNRCRQQKDDRLNQMVFVLTAATALFAPVQFMAGVYGMNFAIDGVPTMPELLWPRGYEYFWMMVILYLVASSTLAVWVHRRYRRHQKLKERQMYEGGQRSRANTYRGLAQTHGVGHTSSEPAASPLLGLATPAGTQSQSAATPTERGNGTDLGTPLLIGTPLLRGQASSASARAAAADLPPL